MITTPNLGLVAWNLSSDPYDHEQLAENWVKLDQHDHSGGGFGKQIGTASILDGAITSAKIADGVIPTLSLDAGSVQASHLDTDAVVTSKIQDGAVTEDKIASGLVPPVGVMLPYGGATAPTGWLLCDGSTVSQATYADLYTVIGHSFAADPGGGNFILPDTRGRVLAGVDGGVGRITANNTRGASGGSATHTLSTAEMPSHTHGAGTYTARLGSADVTSGGGAQRLVEGTNTPRALDGSSGSAGSGASHNNLQPYLVINHIIKH